MQDLLKIPSNIFDIVTILNQNAQDDGDLFYCGKLRDVLMEYIAFEEQGNSFSDFIQKIPLIRTSFKGKDPYFFKISLLCKRIGNPAKFFYEMIDRWLLPGKKPHICSFFSCDFVFSHSGSDPFCLSEMVISTNDENELKKMHDNFLFLQNEIRLGSTSVYQASCILENKGLSADQKNLFVQERISLLIQKRPQDFDYDIFHQMQHFLFNTKQEFKAYRDCTHMARIISVFYLLKRALVRQTENCSVERFIKVKLRKTWLQLPLGFKKVLGVFLAIHFLNDDEQFEQVHCMRMIKSCFSDFHYIEGSYFSYIPQEGQAHLIYLELEKKDASEISSQELKKLNEKLIDEVENGIHSLMHPLFIPRNEEEVIRNMILLSKELRYFRDIPQVIINFDEQLEADLLFTVILVRVRQIVDPSMQQLFNSKSSSLIFIPDRIKQVGMLRKKYPKEASVFRLRIASRSFIRSDHRVDLFQARQFVTREMEKVIGEFRDFNGGMIAKQYERFSELKKMCCRLKKQERLLLEYFFHSIYPKELSTIFDPLRLKELFILFLDLFEKSKNKKNNTRFVHQMKPGSCFFVLSYFDHSLKSKVLEKVAQLQISSSQLIAVLFRATEWDYLCYGYLEEDTQKKILFIKTIQDALDF
ncbi:MAG TPA: hypothetical protein VGZ69_00620 [Candidatus Rhabdochlamydia sp.]|jgi:predicted small secreted protein|nr:hypothetical protein [Candidatus Rhabdochlamydia sp.]